MIAAVYRVTLAEGKDVVVKAGDAVSRLDVEGDMLRHLAQVSGLPLPPLIHSEPDLLVLGYVEGSSDLDERAQEHAAELLAALHGVTWTHYGHTQDTLIGPLHQPNPPSSSWVDFFREQRLLYMAREALRANAIDSSLCARIDSFAGHLERWLDEARQPALVHGDVWATNLLASEGRITAFLDPAIYYAHEEIELAYTTLFGSRGRSFGDAFYRRYQELAANCSRLLRGTAAHLQPLSPAGACPRIRTPLPGGSRAHSGSLRLLDRLHKCICAYILWRGRPPGFTMPRQQV